MKALALRLLSVLCLVGTALAADYSIDWHSIDGGGGTSTGGVYSVSGTIGQPDAGQMSGGPYTLSGGFWSMINVVQTPGAPVLTIKGAGQGVTLSWPVGDSAYQLEQTQDLKNGIWTKTPGTVSDDGKIRSLSITPASGTWFYRLKK